MRTLHAIGLLLLGIVASQLLAITAYAGALNPGIIDAVAGPLNATPTGGAEFGNIAASVADLAVPLINVIAIVAVVVAGVVMTLSQSEEQATQARRAAIGSIVAIGLVNVAGPIRNAVINNAGGGILSAPGNAATAGAGIETEVAGIINYIQVPLATIAVLMIIISGFRAVVTFGTDEGLVQIRRTLFSVVFGITLIAVKSAITGSIVVTGEPTGIIGTVIGIINTVLTFVGLIAVTVIVIAGFFMILNVGNDDQYRRARDLILRVVIGLIVIMASAALVNIIFAGASN